MKLISKTALQSYSQQRLFFTRQAGSLQKFYYNSHQNREEDHRKQRLWKYPICFSLISICSWLTYQKFQDVAQALKNPEKRSLRREDVAIHNNLNTGIWVIYRGSVYDISDFVKRHPGGSHTIMLAAGGDVDPFWDTYTFHREEEVQKLLSQYKIGELELEEDKSLALENHQTLEGPYANDPERSKILIPHTKEPYNAETPSKLLVASQITPTEIFFVRNHLPVPEVDDLKDFSLSICLGSDCDPEKDQLISEFSLEDLKTKFEPHTVNCIMQCSGNRRSDLKKINEIKGLNWDVGAIGNATWTGARLVDVLDSLGVKRSKHIKHVQLQGLDSDMTGQSYAASISADIAFDPARSVLLAYEMNGKPLTRDHGYPLRFIVPGVTGARNVKWLTKITLSEDESCGHWQRSDYKSFSPNVNQSNIDFKKSISIQEMPVQSAICSPSNGDIIEIDDDTQSIPIMGYAYSGGGKMIVRVDVSSDNGATWITADLLDVPRNEDGSPDYTDRNLIWSWTRWSVDIPINKVTGNLDLLCRAFDASYNSQPERPETIWNVRGVVNNSWHRIQIKLVENKRN